jgi:hypothetical protein
MRKRGLEREYPLRARIAEICRAPAGARASRTTFVPAIALLTSLYRYYTVVKLVKSAARTVLGSIVTDSKGSSADNVARFQ